MTVVDEGAGDGISPEFVGDAPGGGSLSADPSGQIVFTLSATEYDNFDHVIVSYRLRRGDETSNTEQIAFYRPGGPFDPYGFLLGGSGPSAALVAGPPVAGRAAPEWADPPAPGDALPTDDEAALHGVTADPLPAVEPADWQGDPPPAEPRRRSGPPVWDDAEPDAELAPGWEPTPPVV